MGILGIGVFLLLILIGTCYYMCRKKNNVNRTRSTDSADSASSENWFIYLKAYLNFISFLAFIYPNQSSAKTDD